jgi:hypothetical protein
MVAWPRLERELESCSCPTVWIQPCSGKYPDQWSGPEELHEAHETGVGINIFLLS